MRPDVSVVALNAVTSGAVSVLLLLWVLLLLVRLLLLLVPVLLL